MSSPYVAARDLGKSFGDRTVLTGLTFEVQPGDVVGVLGKNGAGKTTLLELMLGFTPPSAGEVRVFGHDSFRLPAAGKARVGFVPQQDELLNQLSVRDQLRLIGSFYSRWDAALVERLSERWEMEPRQRVRALSVGQRQRLSILLALGHRPDLLILDEPVASLDPMARRQFLEQTVEVAADGERSVVFSSHIVSDVERLANRIWILKEGRMFWQGDLDTLKESVVRLHIRSPRALPPDLDVPNAISIRRDANHATAVVRDWSEEARTTLGGRIGASFEVEALGLEEILLELHQ